MEQIHLNRECLTLDKRGKGYDAKEKDSYC